jgi:hypothetical protein
LSASASNEKFDETKSNILGTSNTVLVIVLAFAAVAPISVAKKKARCRFDEAPFRP